MECQKCRKQQRKTTFIVQTPSVDLKISSDSRRVLPGEHETAREVVSLDMIAWGIVTTEQNNFTAVFSLFTATRCSPFLTVCDLSQPRRGRSDNKIIEHFNDPTIRKFRDWRTKFSRKVNTRTELASCRTWRAVSLLRLSTIKHCLSRRLLENTALSATLSRFSTTTCTSEYRAREREREKDWCVQCF